VKTEAQQLAQARERFREFHEVEPRSSNDIVKIGGTAPEEWIQAMARRAGERAPATLGLAVGRFVAITYLSVGDGQTYTHEFNRKNRPIIYVNSDGRQAYILEGEYRFTRRGFIG
jgi:hypothetical protein